MKILLSLTALCIFLNWCDGACFFAGVSTKIVDGEKVVECIDNDDGSVHSLGSIWNSAHCMRCSCGKTEMTCCSRYGGIVDKKGCTSILDKETCTYKHYQINDPSVPC